MPAGRFLRHGPGRELLQVAADRHDRRRRSTPTGTCRSPRSAVVELVNEDDATATVEFEIVHAPLARPFEGLGHFHCKWHRDMFQLPEGPLARLDDAADRRPRPVLRRDAARVESAGGWWGEGDEKFFVDGEKFPSTFGTGSEDYFGYAWCHPGPVPAAAPLPDDDREQRRAISRCCAGTWSTTCPFQKSFEGMHREVLPNRGTGHPVRLRRLLVPGARRRSIPTGRSRPNSATATTSSSAADRRRVQGPGPSAGQRRDAGHGRVRRRQVDRATTSSGGPAPSRATSSTWPCR